MTYPTIMPALTLDFQNSQQLDPRVTFSRSSGATYINSAGSVVSAAEHEPRFDHDGNGECLGLLIEEARTNVIEYSTAPDAQFTQDASNFTYTFNQPAPDGSSDAYLMENVSNTSGNRGGYFASHATIPTTGKITVSVFVKPIGGQVIFLGGDPSNQGYYGVPLVKYDFTVSPPEASSTGEQQGFTAVPSIQEIGNGWYRLIEVIDLTNGTSFLTGQTKGPRVANTTPGTSTVVWGYQIEVGECPTSYIPTSGSEELRSQDIAQVDTADIYGDEFTIINKPFGVSSGGPTLHLQGYPHVERAVVYNGYLSQEQINSVAQVSDGFWRWRVVGNSWEIKPTMSGNVTVDWGDGSSQSLANNVVASHTFANGGGYHDVGFRLDSGSWFSVNLNYTGTSEREKVVAVGPMPVGMATTGYYSYNYAANITAWDANIFHVYGGPNPYQLGRTYSGLTSLKSFPFIVLDSQITSLSQAFKSCSALNFFPLIDTSSITKFNGAWERCSSLTSFPLLDTSLGENFSGAWSGCSSLTPFPLLDTSSGTNFESTWSGCSSLTSFPLLDTSLGENLSSAWRSCSSLTSFPLIDTSSATNLQETWYNCYDLNSLPLIDTSSVTNFYRAWRACYSLTSFPLINPAAGTNFKEAWRYCDSLTDFPANFFDSWTGTPVNSCFVNAWDGCTALTATSVENILNSIDTSGQSAPASNVDITIDYDTGTGTPNITTAVTNLKSRGWTITINGVLQ